MMEWVRQRFRLRVDSSRSCMGKFRGDKKYQKQFRYSCTNQSLYICAIAIVIVSVISLPSVVLSAADIDLKSGSINSINYNSDQNPKSQPVWRSVRQAGDGFQNSTTTTKNTSGDDQSPVTQRTKRPIIHRKAHPDAAIISKDANSNNTVDLDKNDKKPRPHKHGHVESEGPMDELHKIQSILRDIFFDEFDPEEDEVEEEVEETEYTITHEDLSRSSQNDFKNKSLTPHSRHVRSEPQEDSEGQGRAGMDKKKGKKRGRPSGSKGNSSSNGAGRQKKKSPKASSKGSDLAKYNEYMDSVFRRMNTMIKSKKMDPLRVNLYAGASKNPAGSKTGSNNGGNKANKGKKKYSPRMNLESDEIQDELDEDYEDDLEDGPARRDIFLNVSHHEDTDHESTRKIRALLENVNATDSGTSDSPRGTNGDSKPKKPKQSSGNKGGNKGSKGQGGNKKPGNKPTSGTDGDAKVSNKNKKNNRNQKSRPTRGILHGLSTLKREGNVAVIKQGEQARIVRANFLLGPVSLEIMPKKGKASDGGKPVAATATASKLKGVLEVRLKKGSPTRIRRLRVYPPKNVKVEGTGQATKGSKGNKKPQQYGKVTPMATARLRQIASTVVRQADKSNKSP